jgi:hypothetical protein
MFKNCDKIYSLYLLSEYKKIDYLNESVLADEYDWSLFDSFVEKSGHVELLESFKLIRSDKTNKNELIHVYEIETLKNLKFEVQLNYSNFEKSYELANSRESEYNFKKNNKLSDNYSSLKSVIKKENGIVCMIMFKDSEGSTDLTGKVDMVSGIELFRTLNEVVRDSFINTGMNNTICCIGIRIYNPEKEKRLKFYQMLHKKYWTYFFPNTFIDEESERSSNYTLLYFYK